MATEKYNGQVYPAHFFAADSSLSSVDVEFANRVGADFGLRQDTQRLANNQLRNTQHDSL